MIEQFRTRPEDARCVGWRRLRPGGVWHSVAPLIDAPSALPASLGLKAEAALARFGARLPNRGEARERMDLGFQLDLVILPDAEQLRGMPRMPGEDERAYQIRIRRDMGSRAWAQRSMDRYREQIHRDGWLSTDLAPLTSFGKWPFRDGPDSPPPGRTYLIGGDPDGRGPKPPIQQGAPDHTQGPHAEQFDYMTLVVGVIDADREPPPDDPVALALLLGELEQATP